MSAIDIVPFIVRHRRSGHWTRLSLSRMISFGLMVTSKGASPIPLNIASTAAPIFSVTKKLTQFFFHDILDNDRNRLAENLTVGATGGRSIV